MTGEEHTTGSVNGTAQEQRWAAQRSRWWNSTGGGTWKEIKDGKTYQKGNIRVGDGGMKFREEWPELDAENWKIMREQRIDTTTGNAVSDLGSNSACAPGMALRRPSGSQPIAEAVFEGGRAVGAEDNWVWRNKLYLAGGAIFIYVLIARLLGEGADGY
jgi:ubiquitin-conjugating enzyme E2 J2